MANQPKRLSPEKAAFIAALANFTDEQISAFMTGGVPAAPVKPATKAALVYPKPYRDGKSGNLLIIGDLHAPFIKEGYLEWCREMQIKFQCSDTPIFIGDIVDLHSCAQWDADPDGMGAGAELEATRNALTKVYAYWDKGIVLYGNHDLRIARKAKSAGMSSKFLKSLAEIYDTPPGWSFTHEHIADQVRYIHGGAGGNAERMTLHSGISTVQGHLHTQAGMGFLSNHNTSTFYMQTGCGVDHEAYAFAYAKPYPKQPVLGCSVVLENGTLPISLLMPQ